MIASRSRPLFRADHVGSLLRPRALKEAHRAGLSGDALREVQDRAIRDAVAMQEAVGLEAVTDGEFRRGGWFTGFVQAVAGITTRPARFDFEDALGAQASWQTAYVEAKLARTRSIALDEFSHVRSLTARTPKVTLPAPSIVHFFRGDEAADRSVYPDLAELWADLVAIYREEIAELGAAGCTYLQLDEVPCAMLCDHRVRLGVSAQGLDPEALLDTYVEAINAAIAGRPPGMTVAIHLCRGNYRGRWMAAGGYEPIAERLFARLAVDTFFLEFDSDRAGGFGPLRFVPADKGVVLGLVSSKTPGLEPADALARRIDAASRIVPLERLAISPQCGFASSAAGNPLSEDDQRAKLARVVEVARKVWA